MNEIEKAIDFVKDLMSEKTDDIMYNNKIGQTILSALEAQQADAWIPITERWPDKKGYYLTTYREWTDGEYLPKYDDTYIRILRYQNAVFKMPVNCDKKAEDDTHREVIAWKPLPEPYKEEQP